MTRYGCSSNRIVGTTMTTALLVSLLLAPTSMGRAEQIAEARVTAAPSTVALEGEPVAYSTENIIPNRDFTVADTARGVISDDLGGIRGMLIDADTGLPIPGTWIWGWGPAIEDVGGSTDAAGTFSFVGLEPGQYVLRSGSAPTGAILPSPPPGYTTPYAFEWYDDDPRGPAERSKATPISVLPGETTDVLWELSIGGTIEGSLRDAATGEPVRDVEVYWWIRDEMGAPDPGEVGGYLVLGNDGSYRIESLRAGDYMVCFDAADRRDSECWDDQPMTSPAIASPGDDITVNLAETTSGIDADLGALPPGGTFVDDNGNVHEGHIEAIAAKGITWGCNPPVGDRFCPSDNVTRGQMAAFLRRALGLPTSPEDFFIDDAASVFEADINALAAVGVTKGCNPAGDRFCPSDNVTRGQMAALLRRAFGYPAVTTNFFTDDAASIFEGDINAIAAVGVTKGCNPPANDRFCPHDPVHRDQMASFLARALETAPIVPPPPSAVSGL